MNHKESSKDYKILESITKANIKRDKFDKKSPYGISGDKILNALKKLNAADLKE